MVVTLHGVLHGTVTVVLPPDVGIEVDLEVCDSV